MESRAPDHVDLVYRKVGATHVFASKGIRGLVHVGHTDLKTAIRNVIQALSLHVSKTYGINARYVWEKDSGPEANDENLIGKSRVYEARLDQNMNACH